MEAAESLRFSDKRIVLIPSHSGMEGKLEGDLAEMLNIAISSRTNGGLVSLNSSTKRKNRPFWGGLWGRCCVAIRAGCGGGFKPSRYISTHQVLVRWTMR